MAVHFHVQQTIHINLIKVGGITNSSVLQIGSAGIIKPASYLYNTGGFTKPAPEATGLTGPPDTNLLTPSVPLTAAGTA